MKLSEDLKESMQTVLKAGKCRCGINVVCLFCDFQPYCVALREAYKLAKSYLEEDNSNDNS